MDKMNHGVSFIILLVAICSCKAVRIRFGELDYVANEGDARARVVLVVSDSPSQSITIPIIAKSFDEYFRVEGNELTSDFSDFDLPDAAEFSVNGSGRSDFVRNGTIEVTFPPSNEIQEREVFITLVDDQINEALEGFLVTIDANIDIPEEVIDLDRGGVTVVSIVDNDLITLMFERDQYTVNEEDRDHPDTILVTKGGRLTEQDLEVLVQDNGASTQAIRGTDFEMDDIIRLTFLPSDNALPVPFSIISDAIPESIEQFAIRLAISEITVGFRLGDPMRTTVHIVDNDPIVIGFNQTSYTITEGETDSVCVLIKEPEILDIVLVTSIESMDGTATIDNNDYEAVSDFAILPTIDGTREQCFDVVTIDNNETDPTRNFMIELSLTIGNLPNVMIDINVTTIVVLDDDAPQDPCTLNNCDDQADCVVSDAFDTFKCVCRSGFIGDGLSCEEITPPPTASPTSPPICDVEQDYYRHHDHPTGGHHHYHHHGHHHTPRSHRHGHHHTPRGRRHGHHHPIAYSHRRSSRSVIVSNSTPCVEREPLDSSSSHSSRRRQSNGRGKSPGKDRSHKKGRSHRKQRG